MRTKRITTGIVANSDDANRYCHSIILYPLNIVIPTVRGFRTSVDIRVSATVYSFHACIDKHKDQGSNDTWCSYGKKDAWQKPYIRFYQSQ